MSGNFTLRYGAARCFLSAGLAFFLLCGPAAASSAQIARGKVLAAEGDCAICHTAPGALSPPYAGGYPLHADVGTVYSTNLTPDRQTGIGGWTADQFYRAMHDGVSADGHLLYPAFPYAYFTKMSRADTDAIFAYLKTLKPVHAPARPNKLIPPANIRWGLVFWNLLFLDTSPVRHDPAKSALWNRGADLVNGVAHCGGCHTTKNFLFADKAGKFLQGTTADGWFAPNLTNSPVTGLGAWTQDDVVTYLKTGANRYGRAVGAMQDIIRISTSRLPDRDRKAIAVYLKSLPAAPEPAAAAPAAGQIETGEELFESRCAFCHRSDSGDYPSLAKNGVVNASDPTTLIRVILQGSQSVPVPGQKRRFSMPAFPGLDDAQIAALTTYLRERLGNHAGAVTDRQAARIRKLVAQRPWPW